jgi:hypothetical protein
MQRRGLVLTMRVFVIGEVLRVSLRFKRLPRRHPSHVSYGKLELWAYSVVERHPCFGLLPVEVMRTYCQRKGKPCVLVNRCKEGEKL